MTPENHVIVTAQPDFLAAAIKELAQLQQELQAAEELAPGIMLCSLPDAPKLMHRTAIEKPIFVRHLAPVQTLVPLTNTEEDLANFAIAISALPQFTLLGPGQRFAVQSRLVQNEGNAVKRPYTGGKLNQMLAEAFSEETSATESVKKPQIIISLLLTPTTGYIGISTVEENLSAWPGGMRHYAQTEEQISRAEFKLLEALETFGVSLPNEGWALDLGAAPGGWSRLLLEAGLKVVAVDPANLDPRLQDIRDLKHYQGYAEDFIEEAIPRKARFDIITNDMRMDAREAARLLVPVGQCLKEEGIVISVLKLPHATLEIDPLKNLREAAKILSHAYEIVEVHQLFHNRQEVTLVAARPITKPAKKK